MLMNGERTGCDRLALGGPSRNRQLKLRRASEIGARTLSLCRARPMAYLCFEIRRVSAALKNQKVERGRFVAGQN